MRTIEDLRNFITEYFTCRTDVRVYLFGSRARGDNTPFSDVDLGIMSDRDISTELALLREAVEESCLPYKVDIVDLSRSGELREVVLKEGIRWL